MDWLFSLNDDQLALMGCGVAVTVSAGLMSISYALRRSAPKASQRTDESSPYSLPFSTHTAAVPESRRESRRDAA